MGVIPCGKCGLSMMTGYVNLHDCIKELRGELKREEEEYARETGFLHDELREIQAQCKEIDRSRKRAHDYWMETQAQAKQLSKRLGVVTAQRDLARSAMDNLAKKLTETEKIEKGCIEDSKTALGISLALNKELEKTCATLVNDGKEISAQLTQKATQLMKARQEIDWIRSNWQNAILVNIKGAELVEAVRLLTNVKSFGAEYEAVEKALKVFDKAIKEEA